MLFVLLRVISFRVISWTCFETGLVADVRLRCALCEISEIPTHGSHGSGWMVQIQPTCDHAEFLNPTQGRRCEKIDLEKIGRKSFGKYLTYKPILSRSPDDFDGRSAWRLLN